VASIFHVNTTFPPHVHQLSLLCRLHSLLLLSHFDDCEFINLPPLSFTYITLSTGSCGISPQVSYLHPHMNERLSRNLHIAFIIAQLQQTLEQV
jgi:hypothetical protein